MNKLYELFNIDFSVITSQKKVTEDIYKILEREGLEPQKTDCIAISTENGFHQIPFYPFNKEECFGYYKYDIIDLKIPIDYKFNELEKLLKRKLKEVVYE